MGGYGDILMIDENGLRMDGRGPGDVREISIQTGLYLLQTDLAG